MKQTDFIAIDFETATGSRASICEAGICIVRDGQIVGTRSWLVQPPLNQYSYFNIQIHGIRPGNTVDAPEFPQVWDEIMKYTRNCPVLVAHNAAFDISCIRKSLQLYGLPIPEIDYYCSLRVAQRIYSFESNKLDFLCDQFGIRYAHHHRAGDDAEMCAKLFLRELSDANSDSVAGFDFCRGKL